MSFGPRITRDKPCARCGKLLPRDRYKFCSEACLKMPDHSPIWPRTCVICNGLFIARHPRHTTCGQACRARRNNRSTPRTRNKRHLRRAVERFSDITPAYEAALRGKTRKCRLCGTYMTSKPDHPNSKHLDHIVPLNQGGTHTIGNVRIICRTCNLSRPRDGSDYTGPVTLWAQVPEIMMPAQRNKPQPKARLLRGQMIATCGCGVEFAQRSSKCDRCHECIVKIGKNAAELRSTGMPWKEVAEQVGYRNVGNLHTYAVRYGGLPERTSRLTETDIWFLSGQSPHDPQPPETFSVVPPTLNFRPFLKDFDAQDQESARNCG